MITATWNGKPVEVIEARHGMAVIQTIDGSHIDQCYVGGQGYVGISWTRIPQGQLENVTRINPLACDAYRNWRDAIQVVNDLTDQDAWGDLLEIAIEAEQQAQQLFSQFLSNSIARITPDPETSSNLPQKPPAAPTAALGGRNEDVYPYTVALHG